METAGFDRDAARLIVSKPLQEDDELTTWQEVDLKCERPPTHSHPVTVGKLQPVDAPTVVSPLCAGATIVRVSGLRPGAIVHLAANQQVYDGSAGWDQTWLDCRVPPLTTDPVSATQELCGVVSPPAAPVMIATRSEGEGANMPESGAGWEAQFSAGCSAHWPPIIEARTSPVWCTTRS